ncbi:hypothetical protein G9A89_011733 [Geosiphon pyriformis]|nr:hypothetical protein G9A89_011733 [Geosiphon pyriformis]
MFSNEFTAIVKFSDLDVMWDFHKLELLVSKIVKAFCESNVVSFVSFMMCWDSLDNFINSGLTSNYVHSVLSGIRKSYHASKLAEFLATKKATIRAAINKRIESFEMNKGHTIRSVLECPFRKVVLDHLVVDDELILKSSLVKSKVDIIMEGWTRKCAFSGVMHSVKFSELLNVISDLPNGKAESVLMNIHPIVLIEMAQKILFKILSNRISLAYSTFDVFCEDNFSVLKSITTQFPIFAIGSVVEDALKKNRELWLVLQDMRKAYDSKSLVKIKMYSRFIQFFSSIHKNCTNRVMTDFRLTDGYRVYDSLDQGEVFFPLLWHIFYDFLLCKVKRQENMCGYRLCFHFILKNGHAAIQHILDIANEFFWINNISINNNKTVVISVNSRVSTSFLSISGSPISIAKKGKSHCYLGIFFSTEGLSKPSLVKANSDICFFINLVLKKTVLDKQFLYLVLAVLHSIVSYRTQFSFVPIGMCNNKVASLVSFANSDGILGHLFSHRSHDFSPVHIHVSASNNFLVSMVHILLDCNLFLGGSLANPFWFHGGILMSAVLDKSQFLRFFSSFQRYDIVFVNQLCDQHGFHWKRLNFCGSVPKWFKLSVVFLDGNNLSSTCPSISDGVGSLNILESSDYVSVCDCFMQVGVDSLLVYTDGFLSNLGTVSCRAGTAAFFKDIDLDLGIGVSGLMSSTLVKFSVKLFSDSQSALDAFECHHIVNVICSKNLRVSWHKVKDHSGISGNDWYLPSCLSKCFIMADGGVVSGNSKHFIHNIYHSVCYACWEIGSGSKFLKNDLLFDVDWVHSSLVWHSNLHMATPNTYMYFMKALHHHLPVVIQKRLYSRLYSSVLYLYCGKVKVSDHVFFCKIDKSALSGFAYSFLCVLQLLSLCSLSFSVFMALFKSFVFDDWFCKAVSIFYNSKVTSIKVVKFVHSISMAFRNNIWLIYTKHYAYMKKNGLISFDGLAIIPVSGLTSGFFAGVLKLLGIADAFGVHFGFYKSCSFFSSVSSSVSVHIAV